MKTMKTQKVGKAKGVPVDAKEKTGKTQAAARNITRVDSPEQVTHETITERAWSIWMSTGCLTGQDETNWYQAERELRMERGKE